MYFFFQISGLETDLASQKEDSKQKLESLQTQMSQVTADLTKLKENDKNEELSTKLSQLGTGIYSISTFLVNQFFKSKIMFLSFFICYQCLCYKFL